MDYDNTDRGSFFKPRADESLLVQGKLDSNGTEHRIVIVKASLPDGGVARDVYAKVGTMYENDKSQNEKSPDFSGPVTLPIKTVVGLLVGKLYPKMATPSSCLHV